MENLFNSRVKNFDYGNTKATSEYGGDWVGSNNNYSYTDGMRRKQAKAKSMAYLKKRNQL